MQSHGIFTADLEDRVRLVSEPWFVLLSKPVVLQSATMSFLPREIANFVCNPLPFLCSLPREFVGLHIMFSINVPKMYLTSSVGLVVE